MDKLKASRLAIYLCDNAHMAYSTAGTSTSEEHEVTFSQVIHHSDGLSFGELTARRARKAQIVLLVHITGETAAIESIRTALSTAVAHTEKTICCVEHISLPTL